MPRCSGLHTSMVMAWIVLSLLTWNIMYPESYIQKSSGVCPGRVSWMAKQCCNIRRHLCGVPGDFVPIFTPSWPLSTEKRTWNSIQFYPDTLVWHARCNVFSFLVLGFIYFFIQLVSSRVSLATGILTPVSLPWLKWKRINNIELVECPAHPNKNETK